ncbi:MAG: hypothetical protein WD335_03380 [Candidatus Paceibacterota bacterium]
MINFEEPTNGEESPQKSNGELAPEAVELIEELADVNPELEFSRASLSQANSMAENADIEATDRLVKTYSYLREKNSVDDKINGMTPAVLSDQKLFNQALLLLGRDADAAKFREFNNQ